MTYRTVHSFGGITSFCIHLERGPKPLRVFLRSPVGFYLAKKICIFFKESGIFFLKISIIFFDFYEPSLQTVDPLTLDN